MFDENLLNLFIQIHINYFLSFMSCMIIIKDDKEDESVSKFKRIELFFKSTYRPSASN